MNQQGNATLGPWALDMTSVAAADNHGVGRLSLCVVHVM